MSQPVMLQDRFLGFKQDMSRDQLPAGYCYYMQDYIPGFGAPARKRGGWAYKGSALTSLNGSAGNVRHVVYAPFTAGAQVLAFDDSLNRLFDLTNSVDRGVAQDHVQAPVFYRNLVIIGSSGLSAPLKYTGSGAPAALGGTPPAARAFAVYKDRLVNVAGIGTASPGRIYFSAAGNPESWDTTNSYVDTSDIVIAIAALPNALVVFHSGSVEVIRGNTPPSATGIGDMSLSPLFNDVGIFGPNAFAVDGDRVIWADQSGIYTTDGAAFTDLTKEGGIKNFWVAQTASATGFCAVGSYNGYAWVSLLRTDRTTQITLLCDIKTRSWFSFYNVLAKNFAPQYGDVDAFYFSNQTTKRAGDLASVFLPSATYKTDPNGTDPVPYVWLPFYRFGTNGRSRIKSIFTRYDMRDAASDDPYITTLYRTTPDDGGYTTISPTLTETTAMKRKRQPVGLAANGLTFILTQTGISSETKLYSIEAEVHPLEPGRR